MLKLNKYELIKQIKESGSERIDGGANSFQANQNAKDLQEHSQFESPGEDVRCKPHGQVSQL